MFILFQTHIQDLRHRAHMLDMEQNAFNVEVLGVTESTSSMGQTIKHLLVHFDMWSMRRKLRAVNLRRVSSCMMISHLKLCSHMMTANVDPSCSALANAD